MKFVLIGGVAIVALVAAAMAALYLVPDRKLAEEVYARICADITKQQQARPSSMELIEAFVSLPTNLEKSKVISEISPSIRKVQSLYDLTVDFIEKDYESQTPHRETRAFIRYSGLNRMGGASDGLSECVFREKPKASGYAGEIVAVTLNGAEIKPDDTVDWILKIKADNLSAMNEVKIGFQDRVRYLTGRITPD